MDNTEINSSLSIKEQRLRLALEKTNTGLFEWHPITNKTYYSPTWFAMLGYDSDELPHSYETLVNLLHPEDKPVFEKLLEEFIHTPSASFNVEFRMLAKHGEYIWIYDKSVAAERDESGHLIRMVGIHSDITERKRDEEILKLKETRYQSFIANSSEHIWCVEFTVPIPLNLPEKEQIEHILDHAYYSEANEAFAQGYGATSEEVVGWPLVKTLPRSSPSTYEFLQSVIRSRYKMTDVETLEVTKDGSEITLLNNFIGTIQDGQVIRVWGTARDITVQKQHEQRLKLKEIRYQSFTANSSEHIWCVDFTVPIPLNLPEKEQIEHILDHGYYSEANEAFAKAYGATSEEVVGWPLVKTLPRSSPSTYEFLQSVIRSRYKMTDVETLEVTKDGSEITLLNNFIGTIQDGRVHQVWGTARDITERKKAEEYLKESEERCRLALEASNDGILDWNIESRHISFSPAVYHMLGYKPFEFSETIESFYQHIHPDDQESRDIDGYKKLYAFSEDNPLSDEFRMLKKDGKLIWVKLNVKVVKKGEDGEPLRIMGTLTDITANKNRTKELIEAILLAEDNERSRISQDIHDGLQQTLILASINLQSIKKELNNKSVKVKEQYELGLQYLQDSISESRVMAHSLMPKSIVEFGIIGAFENTIDQMNMSTRHIQFRFQHNLKANGLENKPLELTLYRVFQEATNNIIKHSGAKNVDIQLKNYKDVLILAIEDDGVGFDTITMKKKDLGFGFKTIRNRLDAINATLEIESSPDKGTVIMVRLSK